jgi:radical SAM protein with 4Fe4S-binding SPASM domain
MSGFKIITGNRTVLRDQLPLKKPFSLYIEPTNMCNFRCTPCAHGSENTRRDLMPFCHMELSLFKKMMDELKGWDGPKLKIMRLAVLGEPLMNPDFCEMVRLAKDTDVAERVDTFLNGSLLTPEIADKLVDYGLDYVRFSIYAATDKRHFEVSRTKVSVEKIRDNIKCLRQIRDAKGKTKPFILVKMFDSFDEDNEIFFNMYQGIADEIGLEKVHNATRYCGNDLISAYYRDKEKVAKTEAAFKTELHTQHACPRPFINMVINSAGDCLMCTHDAPKATRIGNVHDQTLRELWKSDAMFEFRKMQLENRNGENRLCRHCDWFRLFPEEDNVDGFPVEKLRP